MWSKPLVDTDAVDLIGMHKVDVIRSGYIKETMDPSIATVHHYRHLGSDRDHVRKMVEQVAIDITTTVRYNYTDKITKALGPEFCNHFKDVLEP